MRKSLVMGLSIVAISGWTVAYFAGTRWSAADRRAAESEAVARLGNAQWQAQREALQTQLLAAREETVRARAAHPEKPSLTQRYRAAVETLPDYFQRVVEDPEVSALYTAEQRLQLASRYRLLFQKLLLSPAEQENFLKLLIEKRVTAMDLANVAKSNGLPPNHDAVLAGFDRANDETDRDIHGLLGDSGFANYKDYESHLLQWETVTTLGQRIAATSSPLNEQQNEALAKIVFRPADLTWPGDDATAADKQNYISRYADWTQSMAQHASAVLTPQQMSGLQDYLEAELIGLKMRTALQIPARK